MLSTAARLLFGQKWKFKDVPNMDDLIDKIYKLAEMDILTERLGDGNIDKIENYWKPFYKWIDNKIIRLEDVEMEVLILINRRLLYCIVMFVEK